MSEFIFLIVVDEDESVFCLLLAPEGILSNLVATIDVLIVTEINRHLVVLVVEVLPVTQCFMLRYHLIILVEVQYHLAGEPLGLSGVLLIIKREGVDAAFSRRWLLVVKSA